MDLLAPLPDARTVSTPAATMRTLTSPTTGPAMPTAIWRTDLAADTPGPDHAIDGDQFVVVVAGAIEVRIDGRDHRVAEGDGIKLPAGSHRVIAAADGRPASTITFGPPEARATVGEGDPVLVPWTV
jgi:quercetin dioxygenase-like cupin family protein